MVKNWMMSEIYLAIDAFRLISEPRTSGAFVVSEIVRELQHRPEIKKIILLLPRQPSNEFLFQDLLSIEKVDILCSRKQYFPEKNFRGNIQWIQLVIPRLLDEVHVTHLISPYHQSPVFLRRSVKVITIINDICGLLPSAGYLYYKKAPYQHWFNFLTALVRSDAITYISEYTKNTFENLFPNVKRKPSSVIYPKPTISTHLAELEAEKTIRNLGLRAKEYFFAFGTAGARKGTDLTLKAFDLYQQRGGKKKLALLVQYSSLAYVKKLTEAFSDSVVLMNGISNIERDAVYAGAIALLFPSRCEGYGYPILEAIAQGCPAIALRDSPAAEIIAGCIPTLDELNIEDLVRLMFAYEVQARENSNLASRLKLRATEFITQIDAAQKYIDLMRAMNSTSYP